MIEVRLLKAILELTGAKGTTRTALIVEESRLPYEMVRKRLRRLHQEGLVTVEGTSVKLNLEQRVNALVKAVELGADIETTSRLLAWREFEHLICVALDAYSYEVIHSFRFKHGRKRWEVDVLAYKKPLILCIDCKHLQKGQTTMLRKAVERNFIRAADLSMELWMIKDKLNLHGWQRARIIPILVTLLPGRWKIYKASPIVPIVQFKDFISQFTPMMFTGFEA